MVAASERKGRDTSSVRVLSEQVLLRTAGAPLIAGNSIRLLWDASENYPAWLRALEAAERTIHFESYIIHEDDLGAQFADLLSAKARAGVAVRLLYDWLGAIGLTSRRFWQALRRSGVEVRCFNPPRWDNPFGWLNRDHRKMIAVDGRVGFVSGLCIGQRWVGYPERGIESWRDTGIEIRGPAVAQLEGAFGEMWAACGEALPERHGAERNTSAEIGGVKLRVLASVPSTANLYRLDQLVAAGTRDFLWLTDAYFVGTTLYVQALCEAARDGVDVRLLVPGGSDIPLLRALSRAGYRPLLEAGVRVFEWNGPMLHAKTAVADGKWARVGSTNLNLISWFGNWELDVAVEDEGFAGEMMEMYLEDLPRSTEIVLSRRRRISSTGAARRGTRSRGSGGRVAAGALSITNVVGAAITNRRPLGPAEARIMLLAGLLVAALAGIGILWPRIVTVPLAVFGAWIALSLFVRAFRLRKQ